MEGSDTQLLAASGNVLGGKHGRVGRRLVAVGLDLHAAGHAHQRLLARQVRHVDEGVVEGGEDVGDAEHQLALPGGWWGTGSVIRKRLGGGLQREAPKFVRDRTPGERQGGLSRKALQEAMAARRWPRMWVTCAAAGSGMAGTPGPTPPHLCGMRTWWQGPEWPPPPQRDPPPWPKAH